MTHEDQHRAERGGPEMDDGLPDAAAIPAMDVPEMSDAPAMLDDSTVPVFNTLHDGVPVWREVED